MKGARGIRVFFHKTPSLTSFGFSESFSSSGASHLTTSLQAGSMLSAEDQVHLLRAIKEQTITGRNFLRLTDADLASLSLTPGQRLYLLEASRALRAEVLRGCIWVDSYHSKNISAHSKDIYTRSTRNSNSLFNSELYNFSNSSVDLILLPSASIGADGVSPVVTLNRSNSVSDSSAQRYRDLAGVSLVPDQVAVPSNDDNIIAVLEASIASTRAQLEAFRARLEIVEAQVAAQEAVNHAYLRPEEAQQPRNAHQPIDHSCIHDPFPAPDDIVFSGHHLGLRSFARSIITRTMGWLYPYSHPGAHPEFGVFFYSLSDCKWPDKELKEAGSTEKPT
ncbi:hypothetical protein EV702DRAFT_1226507 [Suillus placidus]|uniref:SAM domain-containing protein n=1 Tax=Suillus placidus TaxID=48579 RepID=A0A9P6ZUA7_9AGAM|nr:hypothetical protein EV702DRAFT_1226507 [Suillus placidus]